MSASHNPEHGSGSVRPHRRSMQQGVVNPKNPQTERMVRDTQQVARDKGVRLPVLEASSVGSFENTFAELAQTGASGLVVAADSFFSAQREELVALAARQKVPATY